MTEQEIAKELGDIRDGMRMLDSIVNQDYKTGEGKLNEKQVDIVKRLLKLFDRLSWQINFNNYKELRYEKDEVIRPGIFSDKPGTPVKVRSCKEKHGDKTYFGILIGDVALSISHSIKDGIVTAEHAFYNPAILIPELGEIVYGCESWWGKITSEEELKEVISDETIKNVWYVKALQIVKEDV